MQGGVIERPGARNQQEIPDVDELFSTKFLSTTRLNSQPLGFVVCVAGLDLRELLQSEKSLGFVYHVLVFHMVGLAVHARTPALDVLLEGVEPGQQVRVDSWGGLVKPFIRSQI